MVPPLKKSQNSSGTPHKVPEPLGTLRYVRVGPELNRWKMIKEKYRHFPKLQEEFNLGPETHDFSDCSSISVSFSPVLFPVSVMLPSFPS